jgi:hypothetical protein
MPEGMAQADGFARVPAPAPWQHLRTLIDAHGARDLLRFPQVVAWGQALEPLVRASGLATPRLISGLWFDKRPEANWRVPWHQDLFAPVAPFIAPGWGPWSDKHGIPHVELPEPWCSQRVAIRLHLDDCGPDDGPLEILPGTHRAGKLTPAAIDQQAQAIAPVTIHADAGELLILHPLLLHRSAPAHQPTHRRVLHLEWCGVPWPS